MKRYSALILSIFALLSFSGAVYYLFVDTPDIRENLDASDTEVRSLTKPKTNAAPVIAAPAASNKASVSVQNVASNAAANAAKPEPKAGDNPTAGEAGANPGRDGSPNRPRTPRVGDPAVEGVDKPKPPPEKPISSAEFLADFSPDKVPETVATADEATNSAWRVYCLKDRMGALKVETGEYVPGYKMAKGAVAARIYVGQRSSPGWKTEFKWILFENPKEGKAYLYQLPGAENAIRIHLPFKCGEHDVDASKLAGIPPAMLNVFNRAGCAEVWVLVGEADDLSEKLVNVEMQVRLAEGRLKVQYEEKGIDAVLEKGASSRSEAVRGYCLVRDRIREIEDRIANETKQMSAEDGELSKLKKYKAEIDTYTQEVSAKESDRVKLKLGSDTEETRRLREANYRMIKELKDDRFNRKREIEKELNGKIEGLDAAIAAQQNRVSSFEKVLKAHGEQLELQRKAVADSLAELKKGKLPMTALVILDRPANVRGGK